MQRISGREMPAKYDDLKKLVVVLFVLTRSTGNCLTRHGSNVPQETSKPARKMEEPKSGARGFCIRGLTSPHHCIYCCNIHDIANCASTR